MDKTLKIALILTAVDKAFSVIDKAVSKASKRIQALNSFGSTAAIVGGAITGIAGDSLQAARENLQANRRLEQVFRSMGDATGVAAQQAEDYASKLELQIGVEDEVIMATQAKIATFNKVSDASARMAGIFDRATQAAFDMASAGFGEADQNAVQLGKALQDPVNGINALRRSGITFSDAEKKKIKILVESNKTLEAQKIVLAAVEKQVGGVAKATADPVQVMQTAWSEVTEEIGKKLMPYVQQFAAWLTTFIPMVINWVDANSKLITTIAAVGAALLVVGTVSKIVSAILATNPIVLIIMGIVAAAILIYTYWEPIKTFFSAVWNHVKSVFNSAWEFIKNIFLHYTPVGLVINNWSKITAFFTGLWEKVKHLFVATWEWIKNIFINYTPAGLIIKYWAPITDWFTNMWDKIKNIFSSAWDWIMNLGNKFFDAGTNIIVNIWNGIKSMIDKPIEAIKEMATKIRAYLPFSPAKEGALRDLHKVKIVETIAATIKAQPAINAMKNVTGAIAGTGGLNRATPVAYNSGGSNFNFQFTLNGGATQADADMLTDAFNKKVIRVIKEEEARKKRVTF